MPTNGTTILRGVHVVDTRDGGVERDMDVVIRDDRISQVRPNDDADAGTVIDARGKYLIPGLLDMHTHVFGAGKDAPLVADLMLAHGITGFREMVSTPELLTQRRENRVPLPPDAPRLLSLGGPPLIPLNAANPKAAVKAVNAHREAGADFIKVVVPGPGGFAAAQAEAARVGLPFVGHLPSGVDVLEASRGAMRSLEHLGPGSGILAACSTDRDQIREALAAAPNRLPPMPPFKIPFLEAIINRRIRRILTNPILAWPAVELEALKRAVTTFDEDRATAVARQLAADGTWQCVTLIRECTCMCGDAARREAEPNLRFIAAPTMEEWSELDRDFAALPAEVRQTLANVYALYLRLTKMFDDEGVRLLAGSDAGGIWDIPGAALHQEFDELAKAGLAPLRILQAATLSAAEFLGRLDDLGTVEAGKLADLTLLNADPTKSAGALHEVAGVYRGSFRTVVELEGLKTRVAAAKFRPMT